MAVAYRRGFEAFACYRPTGTRYDLGDLASDPNNNTGCAADVDLVRIAGRYAAWAHADFCTAIARFYIFRRDLSTGRHLRGEPTGTGPCAGPQQCSDIGIGRPSQIVLDSRASVAWIAGDNRVDEVWRFDSRGRRRLARGADIDRNFLQLRAHVLTWRQAGTLHHASLRP